MKEIVILSGKGGVGKSSIAASLGVILADHFKIILADTDVDAPNLALFFNAVNKRSHDVSTCEKSFIDYDKCTGCQECVDACKFSSMVSINNMPIVIPYSCEGCGACTIVCPEDAIEIKKVVNGRINIADINNTMIVSGELDIGESSSGLIVDEVKKISKKEAERIGADLIITDGPPGIGCPVISSIKGSDYVVAVTEPTPAALNDLKRLIEVVEYFKIPLGIVINKSDIHQQSRTAIKEFSEEHKLIVLSEITYDINVPKAIAKSKPVVTAYPDASSSLALIELADKMTDIIEKTE